MDSRLVTRLLIFVQLRYLCQNYSAGTVLLGKITYRKVSLGDSKGEQTGKACPASSNIFYIVPPPAKVGKIVVNCGWKQNLIFYMQNLSYSIPVLCGSVW